jgi:nucleoid-associated protein YgaU
LYNNFEEGQIMAKKEEKKGLLGKAIDAVTSRDEREAAEEALEEAAEARSRAAREAADKRKAQAQARAAEARARAAEQKAEAAEKAAAEAEAKAEEIEREQRLANIAAAREEAMRKAREHAEAAEARARVYVVKSGDSLSKIAKELLGDASRWREIFEANKDQIKDPNLIRVGQELRIPK